MLAYTITHRKALCVFFEVSPTPREIAVQEWNYHPLPTRVGGSDELLGSVESIGERVTGARGELLVKDGGGNAWVFAVAVDFEFRRVCFQC